jgi:Protein of unknown function (DUF2961)
MFIRILALVLTLCVPAVAQTEMGSSTWLSGLPLTTTFKSDPRAMTAAEATPMLVRLLQAKPSLYSRTQGRASSLTSGSQSRRPKSFTWRGSCFEPTGTAKPLQASKLRSATFFGLGLGDYVLYQSLPLQVAPDNALNAFFPMPFQKTARLTVTNEGSRAVDAFYFTIEHGHANHRSDNYSSVAYWYQTEPHAAFPPMPAVGDRLPKIYPVGGPGNAGK